MIRTISVAAAALALSGTQALSQSHAHQTQSHDHGTAHSVHMSAMHDSLMAHLGAMSHDSLMAHLGLTRDSLVQLHQHLSHDTSATHHLEMHEAMMKVLAGSWSGTLESPHGASHDFQIAFARDSAWTARLSLGSGQPMRAGAATRVTVIGNVITWFQDIEGTECAGVAMFTPAEEQPMGLLHGIVKCDRGTMKFVTHKETGSN